MSPASLSCGPERLLMGRKESNQTKQKIYMTCQALFSKDSHDLSCLFCLFDLILYVPSTILKLNRDRSSWVEPVLS